MSDRTQRLARAVYTGALYACLPLLAPYGLLKVRTRGPSIKDLVRRLGVGLPDLRGVRGGVLVHGVSYGEIGVARRLAAALRQHHAGPILLTASTGTGLGLARAAEGKEADAVVPFPLDLPGASRRLLEAARPRALVLVEAELWPTMLWEARQGGMATALVNGRFTTGSTRGYRWLSPLFEPTLRGFDLVAVREEADARRARSLGARGDRVLVTGDIKFDLPPPVSAMDWGGRPLWVAGSTLEGEEQAVLDTHRSLLKLVPELMLVLAPRHPQRFERVAELVQHQALPLARRSRGEQPETGGVLLLDTMGELRGAYAGALFAFVGGSLVPAGGHNVIEPAVAGVPVLVGPHTPNFANAVETLSRAGGLKQVADADALTVAARDMVSVPGGSRQMGEQALAAVERCRGSLQRTVDALLEMLKRSEVSGP
jgi:3-deoxy-D-manno-octulosonic-acid transferase